VHEKKLHLDLFCRRCSQLFASGKEKAVHDCQPADRWQCDQCIKSYRSKTELASHVDIVHRGRRFPCPQCPTAVLLSSAQALKRHVRLVHETRVKALRCSVCGKAFKDRQTLRGHERTHDTSQRSDPCAQCGKVLSSRGALREHVKTVHNKGSFRHTCEDCGQSFPYAHTLHIHAEMAHLKGPLLVCQVPVPYILVLGAELGIANFDVR
jgi:methionyl-tRNA synthetase